MSIATKAVRGVAWMFASNVSTRVLGFVGTWLLTRWLAPYDYGEVQAATAVCLTAGMFTNLGFGNYVLNRKENTRADVFHATVFALGLGLVGVAVVIALGDRLGRFFDAPGMGLYVPGLALSVMLDRVWAVPERILVKQMSFRVVGLSRAAAEISYTAVSVVLAASGWGGMAIVWGNVARSAVRVVMIVRATDRREWLQPSRLDPTIIRRMFRYGLNVSFGGWAEFAAQRWDNLLISRLFGPAVLGAYNFAFNLAVTPTWQVSEHITDVLQSSYLHMDGEQRTRALVRSTALLGLIVFPLAVGLGAVAPTLVAAFLTKAWGDIGPMLSMLSVLSIAYPIAGAMHAYLQSQLKPTIVTLFNWVRLIVMFAAIMSIGRRGPLWACGAVGAVTVGHALARMWSVKYTDGVPMGWFLRKLARPLLACLPLVVAVLLARRGLRSIGRGGDAISLLVEVAAGGLAYVAAALAIAREATHDLLSLGRRALGREQPLAPAAALEEQGR